MTPSERPPVSPRLLNQLAKTLRALEEARREESNPDEALSAALGDLDTLDELVSDSADGALPDGVSDEVGAARGALEEGDVEGARQTLVGVGRSIDDYLKD